MDKTILAYLAGVMDSDGCFTIKRDTYYVRKIRKGRKTKKLNPSYFERVCIKQIKPEAIELIKEYFGGYMGKQKPSCKNGKPLFSAELTNLKAHAFIKAIFPFLRIKKRQAEILFELRESLKRGKTKKTKARFKNMYGNMKEFTRYAVEDHEIKLREDLIKEIKSLNDSRNDKYHTPLDW